MAAYRRKLHPSQREQLSETPLRVAPGTRSLRWRGRSRDFSNTRVLRAIDQGLLKLDEAVTTATPSAKAQAALSGSG